MAKFKEWMTNFDGPNLLKPVPPMFKPGKKKIILQFHDESCFTMNNYEALVWLGPDQTVLQKKGHG